MASSKVISTNPDLPRDSSISSSSSSYSSLPTFLLSDLHHPNTMDDLLKSMYTPPPDTKPPSSATIDDVWKDIVSGSHHRAPEEMTLEDFLTKAGAVGEDDVGGVLPSSITPHFPPPPPPDALASLPLNPPEQPSVSKNKGKRRALEEPLDKATLQKQRRMIKNRESAARSRERKQAYTSELEYLVQQLEEENARLLEEEANMRRQRRKQLMECIIPVEEMAEKPKPKRRLRRSDSTQSL